MKGSLQEIFDRLAKKLGCFSELWIHNLDMWAGQSCVTTIRLKPEFFILQVAREGAAMGVSALLQPKTFPLPAVELQKNNHGASQTSWEATV